MTEAAITGAFLPSSDGSLSSGLGEPNFTLPPIPPQVLKEAPIAPVQPEVAKPYYAGITTEDFVGMDRLGRDQVLYDALMNRDTRKVHELMPEWEILRPLRPNERMRLGIADHYVNDSYFRVGPEARDSELAENVLGDDIKDFIEERRRMMRGIEAPTHRHNHTLSMLDRYRLENKVNADRRRMQREKAREAVRVQQQATRSEPPQIQSAQSETSISLEQAA